MFLCLTDYYIAKETILTTFGYFASRARQVYIVPGKCGAEEAFPLTLPILSLNLLIVILHLVLLLPRGETDVTEV